MFSPRWTDRNHCPFFLMFFRVVMSALVLILLGRCLRPSIWASTRPSRPSAPRTQCPASVRLLMALSTAWVLDTQVGFCIGASSINSRRCWVGIWQEIFGSCLGSFQLMRVSREVAAQLRGGFLLTRGESSPMLGWPWLFLIKAIFSTCQRNVLCYAFCSF